MSWRLWHMELVIEWGRITDSMSKPRVSGKDPGGRRPAFTDFKFHAAVLLLEVGLLVTPVARRLGMSRAPLYRWMRARPHPTV